MWHWFFQATLENEGVDWDCVMTYVFSESGSHCEVVRDSTAAMLPLLGTNYFGMDEFVKNNRPWMHDAPYTAYKAHIDACFPTFADNWNNKWSE